MKLNFYAIGVLLISIAFVFIVYLAIGTRYAYLLRAQLADGNYVEETVCEPTPEDTSILDNPTEEDCHDEQVCDQSASQDAAKTIGLDRSGRRYLLAAEPFAFWPWEVVQWLGDTTPDIYNPYPRTSCYLKRVCNLKPLPKPNPPTSICRTILRWVPATTLLNFSGHGYDELEQPCKNAGGSCVSYCPPPHQTLGASCPNNLNLPQVCCMAVDTNFEGTGAAESF